MTNEAAVIRALGEELETMRGSVARAASLYRELIRPRKGPRRPRPPEWPGIRTAGMTVPEAAVALGIGEEQVRRLLRTGDLQGVGFGGRTGWRLDRAYVERVAAQVKRASEGHDAARRVLTGAAATATRRGKVGRGRGRI